MSGEGKGCDFCSVSVDAAWLYPAHDFVMDNLGGIEHVSTGGWLACPACAEMIEADDWLGLKARSVSIYLAAHPSAVVFKGELQKRIAALHQEFRRRRKDGPRRPFG